MNDEEQNEVDGIFENSLRRETQIVSENTEPSYHEKFKPPRALAILKHISSNGNVSVEDLDYQITKIELTPIGVKHGEDHDHGDKDDKHDGHTHPDIDYQSNMETILRRQQDRGYISEEFGSKVNGGAFHDAFHIYVAESTENGYDPLHIVPKQIENGEVIVLTMEGVDYVAKDVVNDPQRLNQWLATVDVPPKASVDLWPEEIVLGAADGEGADKSFIRGDTLSNAMRLGG